MNTLSRAMTARIFADPDQYNYLRQHWSGLIRSPRNRSLTGGHHLLYLALIGKDWRRGFTPMSSRRKLENGNFNGWKFFDAISILHSDAREDDLLAPFDGSVTQSMLHQIRQMVPYTNRYTLKAESFVAGAFPMDAYQPLPTAEAQPEGDSRDA
jgi:hypothetical protein